MVHVVSMVSYDDSVLSVCRKKPGFLPKNLVILFDLKN